MGDKRVMARSALVVALFALFITACSEPPDPRFATPEASIRTLMSAYGVEDLSEEEVQQRLRARARFTLRDADLYRDCFADWTSPHDEGLAGYVFGRVAAAKDHLRFDPVGDGEDVAVRFPDARSEGGRAAIILRRTQSGYRIVLRRSVPREVRAQLYQVYERALARERG